MTWQCKSNKPCTHKLLLVRVFNHSHRKQMRAITPQSVALSACFLNYLSLDKWAKPSNPNFFIRGIIPPGRDLKVKWDKIFTYLVLTHSHSSRSFFACYQRKMVIVAYHPVANPVTYNSDQPSRSTGAVVALMLQEWPTTFRLDLRCRLQDESISDTAKWSRTWSTEVPGLGENLVLLFC